MSGTPKKARCQNCGAKGPLAEANFGPFGWLDVCLLCQRLRAMHYRGHALLRADELKKKLLELAAEQERRDAKAELHRRSLAAKRGWRRRSVKRSKR